MFGHSGSESENKLKGGSYAVDNCCNNDRSVGAGDGEQLHDGRVGSPPAGNCRCHGPAQHHSGPTSGVRSI